MTGQSKVTRFPTVALVELTRAEPWLAFKSENANQITYPEYAAYYAE